ncbi:MAG: SUMF1/EgtB/PvdO family nonheme iron enzyme, partial [Cytophagales bacterium]|nr:SUMF1/EgtB/PvdO family nonheme iron enzyme [Cytophagales bacterium]
MIKPKLLLSTLGILVVGLLGSFLFLKGKDKEALSHPESENMVYLKGGTFLSEDPNTRVDKEVSVKPFYIDKNLVTVADFEAFVLATGYKTEAEKFGNSPVFDFQTQAWDLVDGANFRYP